MGYRALEQYDLALDSFEKSNHAKPNIGALFGSALCLMDKGQFEDAYERLKLCVTSPDANDTCFYNFAVCCNLLEKWKEAIPAFRRSVEFPYWELKSWHGLGRAYFELEMQSEAKNAIEKGLSIDPNDAILIGLFAELNTANGEYEEALRWSKKFLELEPGNFQSHNAVGVCYTDLEEFEEGILHYHQAVSLEPNAPIPHWNLAEAFFKLGRIEEANREYEWIKKNAPEHLDDLTELFRTSNK